MGTDIMSKLKVNCSPLKTEYNKMGFTILELMFSLTLSGLVVTGMLSYLSSIHLLTRDNQIRLETIVEAQAFVQTLTSELRTLGNGVPFDQANFQIGESTLTDPTVTEPILVSSATNTNISFRLNETGEIFLLTADFNPALSLTLSLTDTTQLAVNDPIYLSNSVIAGDEGLYGTIASVNHTAKTITLNAGYQTTAGAVFGAGSILEEVPLVTYTYSAMTGNITRDSGFGPVIVSNNTTLNIEYLNFDGTVLLLPLTITNLVDNLRSIRVTVTKPSEKSLSSGENYAASVTQNVGIRNLNYFF